MARHPDRDYGKTIKDSVEYFLQSKIKEINTVLPGTILEYNQATRRATVQISIDIILDDMTRIKRPPIYDVPVTFPGGNKYGIFINMVRDDPVILLFSQRGITQFKEQFEQSEPDMDSLFSTSDAIAIPGFGPTEDLVEIDGNPNFAIRDYEGEKFIAFNDDWIKLNYEDNSVEIDDDHIIMSFGQGDSHQVEITNNKIAIKSAGTVEISASGVVTITGSRINFTRAS